MSQKREFKTYKDFHEASTPKSTLAALCVAVRELLVLYENSDSKIADLLKKLHNTAKEANDDISDER